VILHRNFALDPWSLRETELDLEMLAQTESLFALSNGHIGLRGNLDEGEPNGLPGTYLNGFYESHPLPYAEPAYADPEAGQAIVNVTNGKLLRLLVDDEPFDVRYGELRAHERVLDLRAGVLRRTAEWVSPAGQAVRISSVRLVSSVQRSIAAIRFEVEPLESPARVVIQSELLANEPLPAGDRADPRVDAALGAPLRSQSFGSADTRMALSHATNASGLTVAAAADHVIDESVTTSVEVDAFQDVARLIVAADLEPGQRLSIVKFIGYGWSRQRSNQAVLDQVSAAVTQARHTGWDALLDSQREVLDAFWERADVEIDGDPRLQLAVRFALFHVMQAAVRAEQRAIPAKGLTGTGYEGHAFWDTETYVLPVLTYTHSEAAADALRWRKSTLELAHERARQLGWAGAAFPWRTIAGQECSGYWPAGTAAVHINADIADAVVRYQAASQDADFERDCGVDLLVATARLWRSLGHHDIEGRFRIDGVTGPDEYSALADNNLYTNLMAQRNLRAAAEVAARQMERATELGVDEEEVASWLDAAAAIVMPVNEALGVHEQAEGYTQHQTWDFATTTAEHYPLFLHFPYFDLYRRQVVKQADLVLALYLCGDQFSAEEKLRSFDYYEALTVRDSSLSACIQAVVAAEVGHIELAFDYLLEAALIDLNDLQHNTRDGLHIATLAGTWIAVVAGLGGMRDHNGVLSFAPRLPGTLTRIAFGVSYQGRKLRVEVNARQASYTVVDGPPLDTSHHGEPITISADAPVIRPIARAPRRKRPKQVPGRAPARRGRSNQA
jgi:alpha,alpha-trehalose phosphorylase